MRIGPFDFGDDALQRDGFVGVEFRAEGVVRRAGTEKSHTSAVRQTPNVSLDIVHLGQSFAGLKVKVKRQRAQRSAKGTSP